MATNLPIENYVPAVKDARGIYTRLPITLNGSSANLAIGGNVAVTGTTAFTGAVTFGVANVAGHASTAAINSTGTATAAQVATGYITSTSGSATTITLPTGTLLGAQLGATAGSIFELYIDNTAGANTVTIAVAVNGVLSSAAVSVAATFGLLTVTAGVTGIARFTLMFSSATAYVFTRTA